MTPDMWTVIAVGVALATLVYRMFSRLDDHVRAQAERLARVEGLLEGLRDAITGRNQQGAASG